MRRYTLEVSGKSYIIDVEEIAADRFRVRLGDEEYEVRLTSDEDMSETAITPEIVPVKTERVASRGGVSPPIQSKPSANGLRGDLEAPMPGVIVSINVGVGDAVKRGQVLLTMEAMKMQNALRAARDGVIAEVCVQAGQTVAFGDLLVRYKEA